MAKALLKTESKPKPAELPKEPLQALVERVAEDASRRAARYPEDSRVPGGGE